MKWLARLLGLVGLAWQLFVVLFGMSVTVLAPLGASTDSFEFRMLIAWLGCNLLFAAAYLFTFVVSLIQQKRKHQNKALLLGCAGVIGVVISNFVIGFEDGAAVRLFAVPLTIWVVLVLYLMMTQKRAGRVLDKFV